MENKGNKTRTFILLLLFIILAVTVIVRIIFLSGDRDGKYSDPVVSSKVVRGTIYDRHGTMLSFDTFNEGFLVLDTSQIQNAASLISSYTSYSAVEISSMIDDGTLFFPIAESTSATDAIDEIVKEDLLKHVTFTRRRVRNAPFSFMDEITGEAVSSHEGRGGIEEMFNSYLAAVPALNETSSYGEDLVLTIDKDYEKLLTSSLSSLSYEGDCALLNRKGEIIAWYGEVNEELLEAICYSHSTKEATVLFERDGYITIEDSSPVGSFYLWMEEENRECEESIRKALGD